VVWLLKAKPVSNHHDHRKTYVSAPRRARRSVFPATRYIGQPGSECRLSESRKPAEGLSRRIALLGIAALPIAGTFPTTAVAAADPAFALIAEKRAADVAHCAAIDVEDEAESDEERDPDAVEEAFQRCCVAGAVVNEADWRLATTPPTTLAGVAAVLRFANEIEDGGMEWPATDTIGAEGWHYQLRATMAAAIEALIKAGKAVQS
jgi:hypothetical protein